MSVEARTGYETVIGIEVHAQLRTESKMFCACATAPPAKSGTDEPNTRVCPICLGLPGTLPVINRRAVELVMLTGLALDCHVETDAVRFERKNYFYPDLPKGYQISQYALPLTSNGRLLVSVPGEGEVSIGITRAHLEEDTARMQHAGRGYSVVDFNRAGVPLMEIVTEPDLRSPAQARAYGEALRELLRAIGASNADMEAGSMRIEGNVSLRPMGATTFGTKVEVKNLNSFRSLERALEFEVARHAEALDRGESLTQETRGWDEEAGRTIVQRSKEEANDYRYFPEPDLPPLRPSAAWVEELRVSLPELPARRRGRYTDEMGLSAYDAGVLTADLALAAYFDAVVAAGASAKQAANWVTGELSRLINQQAASGLRADRVALRPEGLAELIGEIEAGRLSGTNGKAVLASIFETGDSPREVIARDGLGQVSDATEISAQIAAVLADHPDQVAEYRSGREAVFGFLVGQVMKRTAGRADARLVNEELRRLLRA